MSPLLEDNSTDESPRTELHINLIAMFILSSIMWGFLVLYAFRTHKKGVIIQSKADDTAMKVRKLLISADIACVLWLMESVVSIFIFGIIIKPIFSIVSLAGLILNLIGSGFVGYSLFLATVLTIEALAFAKGGTSVTQTKWLVPVWKYCGGGCIALVLVSIAIVIIAGEKLFDIVGVIIGIVIAVGYGVISHRFYILSRAEDQTQKSHHIPQGYREMDNYMHYFTMKISVLFLISAIIHILSATLDESFIGYLRCGLSILTSAITLTILKFVFHYEDETLKCNVKFL